jgi:hypothetical protein
VIIRNFDIAGVAIHKPETDAPLVVVFGSAIRMVGSYRSLAGTGHPHVVQIAGLDSMRVSLPEWGADIDTILTGGTPAEGVFVKGQEAVEDLAGAHLQGAGPRPGIPR